MKIVAYKDGEGRMWATQLADGMPDADASMGLPVGPPPLASLNLPLETEVRLHNQLYARQIMSYGEAKRRRQDIFAALQAAFRVDTETLVQLYNNQGEVHVSANGVKATVPVVKRRK